jgi:hypothetical protein
MNMSPKRITLLIVGVLILAFVLASCQDGDQVEVTRLVEVTRVIEGEGGTETVEVEVTRVVEVAGEAPAAPAGESVINLAIVEEWANSPHADASAEAFVHWNEDDPAEVPQSCAKCHSTPGYIDFLGADGSEPGVVDAAAPIGSVVECEACHNDVAMDHDTVAFPSGMVISDLESEARCMECHQGRASKVQVDNAIAEVGLDGDPDGTAEGLGFINIHYYAAAATQYGTHVKGGYEYDGKTYDGRFAHVEPYDTCVSCHNPHTLEVQFDECTACHAGLNSAEDLTTIRTLASQVDYDGDGDMEEGVFFEIETLQELLMAAMQAYAVEELETGIIYDSHSYPYFFVDSNGNGLADEGEVAFPNQFASWTPRLLKAAYNYQVSQKDPGRYAHGGKYIIQLLYDSIEDLNSEIAEPIDLTNARRIDHGHFAGSEEAFRHWDEDGAVPASCAKCHSADGLPFFLTEGVHISQEISNGLECQTCHTSLETFERFLVETVEFPSGAVLGFAEPDANLCLNCHQGRAFGGSVDRAVGELGDDQLPEQPLRFINVHYFAAGATLFGSQAHGLYEYEGQEYAGRFEHVGAFDTCVECHDAHALEARIEVCAFCHEAIEQTGDLRDIRWTDDVVVDYDGDGNAEEGIDGEIQTMADALYAALVAYTTDTVGTTIVYDSHAYPYFFVDANSNGRKDATETDGYNAFTPRSLRAAYNYQYVQKDPGAFAHNAPYVIQVLYDTLNDLGADVSGMTRP